MNNLKETLLKKMRGGEIKMVPRWHFVLRSLLFAFATLLVALIAIYVLSFVLFALHETGVWFAPLFGWSGIMLFIVSSPWLLIGVVGIFLGILYVLVSRYAFSYQRPLIYSLVGMILLVIAVSSLIQQTNFHRQTGDFVERHNVPGFAPMYHDLERRPPEDITRGTVEEIFGSSFTLVTEDGATYVIELSERTKLPPEQELQVGDAVMVFGPLKGERIDAFGVLVDDGTLPPPPPPREDNQPPLPSEEKVE